MPEEVFEDGLGFDGSSIRGFKSIEASDMNLVGDPTTAMIDPVCAMPTLSVVCNVVDSITGEAFTRDPRYVAQKAVEYVKSTGIADEVLMGPEAEFFIFDEVSYHAGQYSAGYAVDSEEAPWNSGKPGLGHQIGLKGGYFPVSPFDTGQDLRSDDGAHVDRRRPGHRGSPPRGGHRRPDGDRPALWTAGADGRPVFRRTSTSSRMWPRRMARA